MERAFGTLQGRLPQALRVTGITSVAAANAYLRDVYVTEHNARFGKPAAEPGTAFVPYIGVGLAEVLCVQEDRQVGRDNLTCPPEMFPNFGRVCFSRGRTNETQQIQR
jgi:hypothetical protein